MLPQLEGYDPGLRCWLPGTTELVLFTVNNHRFYTFDPSVPDTPPELHEFPLQLWTAASIPQRPHMTFSHDMDSSTPGFQGFIIIPASPTEVLVHEGQEYLASSGDFMDLWRIPAMQGPDGKFTFGIPSRITNTPEVYDIDPSVSPDMKWVTFIPYRPSYSLACFDICSLDGGEVSVLASLEPLGAGEWSPDSRHVAFAAKGKESSMIVRASISAPGRLVYLALEKPYGNRRDVSWNPAWVNDIDP